MNAAGIPLRRDPAAVNRALLTSLARAAVAICRADHPRNASNEWPDDRVATLLTRAAVSPTSTSNAAVLTEVASVFLESMRAHSAGAELLNRSLQLTFGNAAAIKLPTMAPGIAAFIGEGQPIPTKSFATTGPEMKPHKLACICELSNEVLGSPNAESLTRAALIETAAAGLDAVLFDDQPGDAIRPPGLRNNVAAVPPSDPAPDAWRKDIGAITGAVARAVAGPIIVIAAPEQSAAIPLGEISHEILVSNALPKGMIVAVSTNALAAALDPPRIDSGPMSTIHEADPAAELADIGGILATPVRSAFQTDTQALRIRLPVSWALRAPNAVAWITTTAW
jgi:hypothetical protein